MYSQQTVTFGIFFSQQLQTASVTCRHMFEKLSHAWIAASQKRIISRLPLHLRHDVGDIDYQPSPQQMLDDAWKPGPQTLEQIWLRQFR